MTDEERKHWARLHKTGRTSVSRSDIREVKYYENGPYTCCIINGGERVGFAKCNPNYDEPMTQRGRAISFSRALKS